ncbi:MAG: DUF4340 domain-containing protein [Candidatus Brocadiae bacterium]|nr:DUF4340 domain-containing protein [Candidatus Brocadiia bacterium]
MNEWMKTGGVLLAGAILATITGLTGPKAIKGEAFAEQGKPFFPAFTDPEAAQSLQVVEWDATAAQPFTFKVEFRDGRWVIPSHHNYPADAKDRLAKTATSVIGMLKDSIRTERKEDYPACGVVDPEDSSGADPKARGRRLTLRDGAGNVLADLIIGRKMPGEKNRWFVRVPDQRRVYSVALDLDLSTRFTDWIETDLTRIKADSVWRLVVKDYEVVAEGGVARLNPRPPVSVEKPRDTWTMQGLDPAAEEVNAATVGTMTQTVEGLKIVGIRKKPEGLSRDLKRRDGFKVDDRSFSDLIARGYFYDDRSGTLYSKQGELEVHCEDGVVATLRFGDIFTGSGLGLSSGADEPEEKKDDRKPAAKEARYLMITAHFDEKALRPEAMDENMPKPGYRVDTRPLTRWQREQLDDQRAKDHAKAMEAFKGRMMEAGKKFNARKEAGIKRAKQLQDRFADWYYVIDAESFAKVHVDRKALVKGKGEEFGPEGPPPGPDDGHDHGPDDPH